MSGKWLIPVIVLLVMLTIMGFGFGAGQRDLAPGELPEAPDWLVSIGDFLDRREPLRPDEITECEHEEGVLSLGLNATVTCRIAESDVRSRVARLRLSRGRGSIHAQLGGDQGAETEVDLPRRGEREGILRIPREGAELTLSCDTLSCTFVLTEAKDS